MKKMIRYWAILLAFFVTGTYTCAQPPGPARIACIGASITYGARLENREHDAYPAQLQRMLGAGYQVTNYGVSGTTLLQKGNLPYINRPEYQAALASEPDVVIIDLGGNDAKLINRSHYGDFEQDYQELIRSFAQLASHPRIILLSAMASFVRDTAGIWDPVLVGKINPMIQHVAYTEHVEILDMHSPFVNKEALFADQLHPNLTGTTLMAGVIYKNIKQERDGKYNIEAGLGTAVKRSSFYGYECDDFLFNGRSCKIARPKLSAAGHPWIWRARFWGHEPQTDIALLQQGFHVVYCDVVELLGNDQCISLWNNYYSLMRHAGLAKKVAMEGMSRGGVYVFNWAAVNPRKVAGVYVDNPLLNTSALALKVMRITDKKIPIFEDFKKDYNLVTMEDISNFKGNPVDQIAQIVKGQYPILILCADADEEVPPQDNTIIFEQRVKAMGGSITVMHKPGFKHHPHSLPNPEPIVDFLLKATGFYLPIPTT